MTATGFLTPSTHHVGLMDLRDRSGSDGRSEFDEMIFELAAERPLHRFARLGHRERVGLVLQMTQVGGQFGADDVGARCEKLTELDVAGPEFRQGRCDARRGRLVGAKGRGDEPDRHRRGARDPERQRHGHALRNEADTMLR